MRKMFKNISIRELDPERPLPDFRILENGLYLSSGVDGAAFAPKASLGLEILVGEDALEFCVRNQDDPDDKRSYFLNLHDIPEWGMYKQMSFYEVRGRSPDIVESFLRRAFALPHSDAWNENAMKMGERIGVRVGNKLGVTIGDYPHSGESKRLFTEIAHIALGYEKDMKILHLASSIMAEYRIR